MNFLLSELPSNALKVEVLENLFSLIFVTHRDLQQSEEGSDEENDAEGSSRYDSRHDSSENQQNCLRSNGFIASKKFISALLGHLNTQIRSTKVKVTDGRALQSRLEGLLKHVIDARWRLEIVQEKLLVSIKCVQNIDCDGVYAGCRASISIVRRDYNSEPEWTRASLPHSVHRLRKL